MSNLQTTNLKLFKIVALKKKVMKKHYRCPLLASCLLAMLLVLDIWKAYQNILRWMEKKKARDLQQLQNTSLLFIRSLLIQTCFQKSINPKFLRLIFGEDSNVFVISWHRRIPMTTTELLLSARQQGWVWNLLEPFLFSSSSLSTQSAEFSFLFFFFF